MDPCLCSTSGVPTVSARPLRLDRSTSASASGRVCRNRRPVTIPGGGKEQSDGDRNKELRPRRCAFRAQRGRQVARQRAPRGGAERVPPPAGARCRLSGRFVVRRNLGELARQGRPGRRQSRRRRRGDDLLGGPAPAGRPPGGSRDESLCPWEIRLRPAQFGGQREPGGLAVPARATVGLVQAVLGRQRDPHPWRCHSPADGRRTT